MDMTQEHRNNLAIELRELATAFEEGRAHGSITVKPEHTMVLGSDGKRQPRLIGKRFTLTAMLVVK